MGTANNKTKTFILKAPEEEGLYMIWGRNY
jgi:hypothetical protein